MPAVTCRHDHRCSRATGNFQRSFRFSLHKHLGFHGLTLLIETVKLDCNPIRGCGIVQCQQSCAKPRIADAPASIDARPDKITEVKDIERFANAGNTRQGRKADIALRPRNDQSFDDESAVDTCQRHHIADRCQCHQIEQRKKIGTRSLAALAQDFGHLYQCQKDHACRAKMPLLRNIIFAVGIDDSHRIFRQIAADLMVIEHDDIRSSLLGGCNRRCAVGATIDCDDKGRTFGDQIAHGIGIGAVTFKNPVRNIDGVLNAVMFEKTRHQGGRTRPIDIVIAKMATVSRRRMASAIRLAAFSISVSVAGSGMRLRSVGSTNSGAFSTDTPARPARVQPDRKCRDAAQWQAPYWPHAGQAGLPISVRLRIVLFREKALCRHKFLKTQKAAFLQCRL